jgi:hypothetical protein
MKSKANKKKATMPVGSGDLLGGIGKVIVTNLLSTESPQPDSAPVYFFDSDAAMSRKSFQLPADSKKCRASRPETKNSNQSRAMSRQEKTLARKLDVLHSYDMPPNSIISLNSRVSVLLCFGFHDAIFRRIQKPVNL